MSIDYKSSVGMVRLLIPDVEKLENPRDLREPAQYIFTDEQIETFLSINRGNVRLAAADAIDSIAVDIGMQMLVITTDDKMTDGSKMIKELSMLAGRLRAQAAEERREERQEDMSFSIVDRDWTLDYDWAWRM